ncbi:vesicle-associated membrane protein-associated protein B [Centruroides vittatus]|uniref:vesicle-associated membrane protein-associated protein B n=1 Tax=Centruroides vittatus TaxID=120091 RepID=UPI003510CBD2
MAKQEQVLYLEPQTELHFRGPFTDVVTSNLKLTNPTERRVCFKVKTTAPKRYCVRPNSGIIEPRQAVNVAVMLQPFEYDPNEKNRHKFMVQTMFAPEGDINQETLWRDANPESLMDSKLRCVFIPETTAENNLDSSQTQREEKPATTKVANEPAKSSPKTSANFEVDLRRAAEENKRLKEDIAQLKQENSQLKEEGLRLRISRNAEQQSLSQRETQIQMAQKPQLSWLYLVIVIFAFFLGYMFAKYFL